MILEVSKEEFFLWRPRKLSLAPRTEAFPTDFIERQKDPKRVDYTYAENILDVASKSKDAYLTIHRFSGMLTQDFSAEQLEGFRFATELRVI